MHAYVFIYTLVPGIWALALDILAVAPFGSSVVPIVKPKKTVHKKRCSTHALCLSSANPQRETMKKLLGSPVIMSSQGFEGEFCSK